MGYDTPLTPTDPAAVDFRAFYPYTPNEVKHRKRTTSAQLKVLEDIFKKDTKPNATLRTDLAAELDMTPRGVQVWFQNRRAKEKVKASKASMAAKNAAAHAAGRQEESSASRNLNNEGLLVDATHAHEDCSDAFSRSPSSAGRSPPSLVTSPPQLHLITDATNFPSYSPADQPPDSAASYTSSRPALHSSRTAPTVSLNARFGHNVGGDDLYQYRRGSLPVNAFPQPQPSAETDACDPFVRRRSVDASLQRLASNPFASLARAKNSVLYGPGFGVAEPGTTGSGLGTGMGGGVGRHHQMSRLPYGYQQQRRGVSSLPSASPAGHLASMPQHVGLRRSSMDSRSMRLSQLSRFHQTPSPSPLTPYNAAIRVSLPDHHLYAVTSRPVASPIPGPLPSPGFSFGAASSTPPMASPSSGDSERNSPDSLRSFTFRGEETEQDDDATSPSYDAYSRFGSIASIATSESSVNSSYYAELGGAAAEHAHLEDRHDSCASGNFLGMLSGLDVGNHVEHMDHAASMGLGIGAAAGYLPTHEDYTFSANAGEGLELVGSVSDAHLHQQQPADQQQQQELQYPSPASTIAPNSNGQSPQSHAQDAPSATVPISTSSELAFALEGKPGQTSGTASPQESYVNYGEQLTHSPPEQMQHETSYFPHSLEQQQDATSSFAQTFSFSNGPQQQQQLDYGVFDTAGNYVDPLVTSGVMDNGLQSVEAFVAYT